MTEREMSHRAGSYYQKKRQERRERVERSGTPEQIDKFREADRKGNFAKAELGASVLTKNPVSAARAAKEIYDGYKEQNRILDSLDE